MKPHRISSCFRFLSEHFVTALFFNLTQDRDASALNTSAKSRACFLAQTHGWAEGAGSSPTSATPGASEALPQQENNSSIFKRVRCRMESILFLSFFLSYVFMQLSHLKAQQIFFNTQKCWLGVLVLLTFFVLFVVRHYWQAVFSYENNLLLVTSSFPCSAQLIQFADYTDPFLILFNTGNYWKQNWDLFSLNIYR